MAIMLSEDTEPHRTTQAAKGHWQYLTPGCLTASVGCNSTSRPTSGFKTELGENPDSRGSLQNLVELD